MRPEVLSKRHFLALLVGTPFVKMLAQDSWPCRAKQRLIK